MFVYGKVYIVDFTLVETAHDVFINTRNAIKKAAIIGIRKMPLRLTNDLSQALATIVDVLMHSLAQVIFLVRKFASTILTNMTTFRDWVVFLVWSIFFIEGESSVFSEFWIARFMVIQHLELLWDLISWIARGLTLAFVANAWDLGLLLEVISDSLGLFEADSFRLALLEPSLCTLLLLS